MCIREIWILVSSPVVWLLSSYIALTKTDPAEQEQSSGRGWRDSGLVERRFLGFFCLHESRNCNFLKEENWSNLRMSVCDEKLINMCVYLDMSVGGCSHEGGL